MFTKRFALKALDRMLRAGGYSLISVLGVEGVTVLDVDWKQAAGITATAMLLSVLGSVTTAGVGPGEDPSLV